MITLRNGQVVLDEFKPTEITEKQNFLNAIIDRWDEKSALDFCKYMAYYYRYLNELYNDPKFLETAVWYDDRNMELTDKLYYAGELVHEDY